MALAAPAAGHALAHHAHPASADPWIGLIAITLLSLGLLVTLLVVVNRPLAGRGAQERRDQDGGLEAIPLGRDADGRPAWWSQFEREFAAYVNTQKSTRFGRRRDVEPDTEDADS